MKRSADEATMTNKRSKADGMTATQLKHELGELLGSEQLTEQLRELLAQYSRGEGTDAVFGWLSTEVPKKYKQKLDTATEALYTLELSSLEKQKQAFKNAVEHASGKVLGHGLYRRKMPVGWNEEQEFNNFLRAWGTSPCELFLSTRLGIMDGILGPIRETIKALMKAEDRARMNPIEAGIQDILDAN